MTGRTLPILYVEGSDDVSVINALLGRHGLDTERGAKHLSIKDCKSYESVVEVLPDAVRAATDIPVGFVVDIDVDVGSRWADIRRRLNDLDLELDPPEHCPHDGYHGRLQGYPHPFGVWLMPDCQTDGTKLEHFVRTLVPDLHPLWPHAQNSVMVARSIIDDANRQIDQNEKPWRRFRDVDQIKAEIRSWLAWQSVPGVQLGAAVNDKILGSDSPEAIRFLRWLKTLFGLEPLAV